MVDNADAFIIEYIQMVIHSPVVVSKVILFIMLIAYRDIPDFVPLKITGVVKEDSTGRPVPGVHVFHVKGEEESFTDESGEFILSSWQQLPVAITAEHPFYKGAIVTVSDKQTGLVITLKRK